MRSRLARTARVAPLVAALTTGPACHSSPAAPLDPGTPGPADTITITSAGASPLHIEVAVGSRVRFVNNDVRSHNMTSDPHPEHDACPEINQVGFLSPGQSRETGNLVVAETCGFHDHDNPDNETLHGQIVIR